MKKVELEVVKIQASTKEEATIKLLTTPVGDGIRLSNQEIFEELVKGFGSASMNSIYWYSSRIGTDPKWAIKYKIEDSCLVLTPRKTIKK